MDALVQSPSFHTERLLSGLHAYFFPAGEQSVAFIRTAKTTETGQLHMSPGAPWIPFAADQEIDFTRSQFHWEDPNRWRTIPFLGPAWRRCVGQSRDMRGDTPVRKHSVPRKSHVPRQLKAAWHLPGGVFPYFQFAEPPAAGMK